MDEVRRFAEKVIKELGARVRRIILYGSAARGELGEESDVDVLVVVNRKDQEVVRKIEDIAFESMKCDTFISPVIIDEETYRRMLKWKYPFIMNVEAEGIVYV